VLQHNSARLGGRRKKSSVGTRSTPDSFLNSREELEQGRGEKDLGQRLGGGRKL